MAKGRTMNMSIMQAHPDVRPPGTDIDRSALRFERPRDPRVGFAESVAHLMTKLAFARAPFGHIARIVGFVGWARASEANAEAWLAGTRGIPDAEARSGDCALINCWQADDPEV